MKGLIKFFTKNYKKIVLFMLGVSVIYFVIFHFFIYSYIKEELHHRDRHETALCSEETCGGVIDISAKPYISYSYKNHTLIKNDKTTCEEDFIKLNDGIFVNKNTEFYYIKNNFMVNIKIMEFSSKFWEYYIVFLAIFTLLFINILGTSLKEEREESLRLLLSNEAMLANKAMILITENIHHELNTPMEVIENKIDKIKELIMPLLGNNVQSEEILYDFKLIEESSEAVHNTLYRMKGFKHLRYSNGNKTLYDILHGAFRVINVSESNYTYFIDKEFKKYRISGQLFRNADLLNISINHIKNSLTACATEIHIKFNWFDNEHVYFRIIDNGNGIPRGVQKNIFEANFSTKDIPGQISGNGLYLNKSILTYSEGDIKLIESSIYGTTFEIMLPSTLV